MYVTLILRHSRWDIELKQEPMIKGIALTCSGQSPYTPHSLQILSIKLPLKK